MGPDDDCANGPGDDRTVVVGLVADPGLPTEVANRLADELPEALRQQVNSQVSWQARVTTAAIPLDERGNIPVAKHAREEIPRRGWDLMIFVTDLPRLEGTTPIVGDVTATHEAGVLSLPGMGWIPLRRHVQTPSWGSCRRWSRRPSKPTMPKQTLLPTSRATL